MMIRKGDLKERKSDTLVEVLSSHSYRGSEEINEKLRSIQPMLRPGFETSTSDYRYRSLWIGEAALCCISVS
jgi:hypothetical protein